MRRHARIGLLFAVLVAAAAMPPAAAPRHLTDAPRALTVAPPAFTAKQLGTPAGNDWIAPGGDVQNDHFSTLQDVNLSNVGSLRQAWHVHLGETKRQQMEATGLAYQGTYYIVAGNGDVFAYDGATGAPLWKYTAPSNLTSTIVRGIAMGDGKIFYGEVDNYMVAIDATTGQLAWKSPQIADPALGYSLNAAATYFDGMVYEGVSGSESGIRGFLQAWDAKTGKLVWRRYFVPGPQDPAYKTWGDRPDWAHGGGGVWTHPVVDAAKGIIYVGTANAAPYHQRPAGNDLYTASEVALNAKTGKILWYYQFVHHDDTDFDVANSAVLYDAPFKVTEPYMAKVKKPYKVKVRRHGRLVTVQRYAIRKVKRTRTVTRMMHAIDQAAKTGFNFILDRYTGKPLIPTPEVPQPQNATTPYLSKTQPVPFGQPFTAPCATPQEWLKSGATSLNGPDGKPIIFGCNFTPIITTQYTVPGWHDDADWPTSTYSLTRGRFYVCSTNNRGDAYEAVPIGSFKPTPGNGTYTGNVGLVGGDWVAGKDGSVTAYDPSTNNIVWRATMPDGNGCYSGLTATAGDLVFVGTLDGHLLAYDATTGNLVWQSPQLDASVASSANVYRGSDGKEYVTILVGGYTISQKAKLGDSVYAFALP
jgi:glucose dehydrogenase